MRARPRVLVAPLALLALVAACQGSDRARAVTARAETLRGAAVDTGAAAPLALVPRAPAGMPEGRFPAPSRPVSGIVSPRWSDEDARDDAGEAQRVLDLMQVRAGTSVADVGAGDGYYTVRAADRVGARATVWAEDIEPEYLRLLQRRLEREPRPNVVLVLGEPHDPRLPRDAVDVALLIHMYHEITQPFGLLYNLYPSLRGGARVGILDTARPTDQHGTMPALLECELSAMGYRPLSRHDTGPGEYLAIFAPPESAAALTAPEQVAGRLEALGCDRIARQAAQAR